jgi:LAS superfamily LD-carboxypeptidase LdcB
MAATPGRSQHGLGLAADLSLSKSQQKWLEANGAKYGIRRLASESWHWQKVGT